MDLRKAVLLSALFKVVIYPIQTTGFMISLLFSIFWFVCGGGVFFGFFGSPLVYFCYVPAVSGTWYKQLIFNRKGGVQ